MTLPYPAPQIIVILSLTIALAVGTSDSVMARQIPADQTSGSKIDQQDITQLLTIQATAWNDGDLEKFMQTYWNSEQLTFSSGGKITRGWQSTLDQYRKNYAPPKQMGKLHFDELEIVMLESESALVLGNWHLQFEGAEHRDGNFSLVMRKLEGQWKIVHDHSSELKTP